MARSSSKRIIIRRVLNREDLGEATLGFEIEVDGSVVRRSLAYVGRMFSGTNYDCPGRYGHSDFPVPFFSTPPRVEDADRALYRGIVQDANYLKSRRLPRRTIDDQVSKMDN